MNVIRPTPGGHGAPSAARTLVLAGLAGVFTLLVALPALVRFAADWYWFGEIGFRTVLVSELTTRGVLFLLVALTTAGVLYVNLRIARRYQRPIPAVVGDISGIEHRISLADLIGRVSTVGVVALSLFIALALSGTWLAVQQFLHAVPFGVSDPIFGRDVGYYVYRLPVITGVLALLLSLTVLAGGLVIATYFTSGDIGFNPLRRWMTRPAQVHVGTLIAVFLVLSALQIWLVALPELLFSTTGPLTGASYTDVHARRPGYHVAAVAALVAAGLVVVGLVRRRAGVYITTAVALYAGISIVGRGLIPAAVQKLVVAPTELTRERPYLAHHIDATRTAWGIDSVAISDIRGEQALTLEDVRENAATVENVRLWDRDPLLQTFGQIQEIRTYYDFVSVDDDRYWINGRYRQVHLSPRELNPASLPTRSFINEHLAFTHGMGITLAPVNQVTIEGLPVLFVKDLPPTSTVSLQVTRPQIYYGELTTNYVVVNTRQPELDYPSGDTTVFTRYSGTGGVPVGGLWRRSLLAWHFRSLKLLLSGDITSESRILYRRHIVDRARRALPFVRFDADPYVVIDSAGTLQWILDGYTMTPRYPYSQPAGDGTTYTRNSVKVVIDAYHGSVRAFIAAPNDPLIRSWARAFPGILQPLDSLGADLRAHLRYPEDLFRVQAVLYATYHMTEPEQFYHREDQWQIPILGSDERQAAFMRRIVMRLPDEEREEFIFMSPFTPRQKDNLAAWMVARNDGEHYGRLSVYRFPRQSLVFGPQQIVNRMNQDPSIAREIALWDQRGSEVIRGALMVIPIEESLIYVQPLYLRAQGGRIPELKRVIVAHQNRVVMDSTLDLGLTRLFGGDVGAPVIVDDELSATGATAAPSSGAAPATDLARRAREHYDRAMDAQRAGNWARYGEEITRLGEVLRQLQRGGTASPPPP